MRTVLIILMSTATLAIVDPARAQYTLGGPSINPGIENNYLRSNDWRSRNYNWRENTSQEKRTDDNWRNNTWRYDHVRDDWRDNTCRGRPVKKDERREDAKDTSKNSATDSTVDKGYKQ
jgi:hypothetical protein